MPHAVRTPEERFADLPDFPWEPVYREWDGLRLAHLDVGPAGGPVVVLGQGEPTGSFLWRKVFSFSPGRSKGGRFTVS